ncbi:MAG: J domain-containing protein [Methanomicrobiaceae archaeon]|nr:J domain-containing protein [Methanomicrobiaceae archaeon]
MARVTPAALREAAEVLGFRERASLNEICRKYREEIKKWHPDISNQDPRESHEMTIRLKAAYDLLMDYCMNYPFSFRIDDLAQHLEKNPLDFWMERFGDDPIWR